MRVDAASVFSVEIQAQCVMYLFTNAHGCNISSMIVKRWHCIPGGTFPHDQSPPLCSNRHLPAHFKLVNMTSDDSNIDGFFMTLEPSVAYEVSERGAKLELYQFIVERFSCAAGGPLSIDIIVFPLQETVPTMGALQYIPIMVFCSIFLLCFLKWRLFSTETT